MSTNIRRNGLKLSPLQNRQLQALRGGGRVRYSGLRLVAFILLISTAVSAWICWDLHQDANQAMRSYGDVFELFFGFNLMTFVFGASVSFQRVKFDPLDQTIWYANFGTLHRWKAIEIPTIKGVFLCRASRKSNAMVDSLEITTKSNEAGQPDRIHNLIDGRISPVLSEIDSKLFEDIVAYIRLLNPGTFTIYALYADKK